MALTDKQQIFVNEYLQCWNATEAARRAGYAEKYLNTNASKLLQNTTISAEIERRKAELMMSADEVLIQLTEQARSDMGEFLEFKDGISAPYLNLKGAYDKGLFRLVKKFKYNANGQPEIELYDAQAALVHIGKQHGLFADKVEVKLAKEIDVILDTLEGVLDADSYQRVLQALSSRGDYSESGTDKTPPTDE